jgi:phage gp36-like protein
MAYCEDTELQTMIGFQASAMQSGYPHGDDETEEEAFLAMLGNVIDEVSALIDGMVAAKYDTAEVAGNAILKRICIAISRYDVYTMFARFDVPETVRLEKDAAMKQLELIQQGKLELVADDAEYVADQMDGEFIQTEQSFSVLL